MPFVAAPNTIMAEMRMLIGVNRLENVLYFQGSAGVNTTLMTTLGNNLANWWDASLTPQLSTQLQLVEVYLTDLTTQTSPTVSIPKAPPLTGNNAADLLPNNVALCVSFRTNGRGKSARGRNYVPGLVETEVSGSIVASTTTTPVVAAYNALKGAGTFTAGLEWVVVSRFHDNAPRTVALVQPITSVVLVDSVVDSQRRRLPGRGR
jgi:hypothetical protein